MVYSASNQPIEKLGLTLFQQFRNHKLLIISYSGQITIIKIFTKQDCYTPFFERSIPYTKKRFRYQLPKIMLYLSDTSIPQELLRLKVCCVKIISRLIQIFSTFPLPTQTTLPTLLHPIRYSILFQKWYYMSATVVSVCAAFPRKALHQQNPISNQPRE